MCADSFCLNYQPIIWSQFLINHLSPFHLCTSVCRMVSTDCTSKGQTAAGNSLLTLLVMDRLKTRIHFSSLTIWNQWWCNFMRSESGSCHLENKPLLMDHHGKHKGKNIIFHRVVTQTPCWNLKIENFECPDFISFLILWFWVFLNCSY